MSTPEERKVQYRKLGEAHERFTDAFVTINDACDKYAKADNVSEFLTDIKIRYDMFYRGINYIIGKFVEGINPLGQEGYKNVVDTYDEHSSIHRENAVAVAVAVDALLAGHATGSNDEKLDALENAVIDLSVDFGKGLSDEWQHAELGKLYNWDNLLTIARKSDSRKAFDAVVSYESETICNDSDAFRAFFKGSES